MLSTTFSVFKNIALQLLMLVLIGLPNNCFSQKFEKKGNVVTYRGNKFTFSPPGKKETITVTDPITGKKVTKTTTIDPTLIRMNKLKIYKFDEVTVQPAPTDGPVETFVIKGLTTELNKLPDGIYFVDLFNIVIDNKGKIVYYEYGGIIPQDTKFKIPDYVSMPAGKKIDSLINAAPAYAPGEMNGKTVVVRTNAFYDTYRITVKNHRISITRPQ